MNDDPPVQNSTTGLTASEDFPSFMCRYQDMVYTTAARLLGNDAQAEDIAQEVFVKAYERWDDLRESPAARLAVRILSADHRFCACAAR